VIAGRHCAQKAPANWYRTIDRITPALADEAPKLLIPDIKGEAHVFSKGGSCIPITTSTMSYLEGLGLASLASCACSQPLTRLFVSTYSTKMRGGFLSFQAQYLRRIRIPRWAEVS
jgi:hypothetical protein